MSNWISVNTKMPEHGKDVLICQTYNCKDIVIVGKYIGEYEYKECDAYLDYSDYNENDDTYYIPAGWYENQWNWDECSAILIDGEVTHWMPLPGSPRGVEHD